MGGDLYMNDSKLKIDILPNYFLNDNGTFNKEEALLLSGKIAGICYNKEGFGQLQNEAKDKTLKRVDRTLDGGHHSVFDHVLINLNVQNIPKILAMVLNNEHQYTTSEKSLRYTPVINDDNSIITFKEQELYNKWINIFKQKIKDKYSDIYNDSKILKLAQENARYLVTVFIPTQMIYSTSFRQINYLVSWMQNYIKNADKNDYFENNLAQAMQDFINELDRLNVIEERLLDNEKHRKLSLFGNDLEKKEEYFGDVYSTTYKSSYAFLAQAQRHRTLDYQMETLKDTEYYIPPIIRDDEELREQWLSDMQKVKDQIPQGELIRIYEIGKFDDFILKCKERLCTEAQLEIMQQTKETLSKYKNALEEKKYYLSDDILKYTHGARCTFPDFDCKNDCKFNEGKKLVRKI